jgi:hypothetical protein
MMGEIFAILTAVLRGYAVVPLRKGLQYSTPSTSSIVYLVINTAMLWALTLYRSGAYHVSGLAGYFGCCSGDRLNHHITKHTISYTTRSSTQLSFQSVDSSASRYVTSRSAQQSNLRIQLEI